MTKSARRAVPLAVDRAAVPTHTHASDARELSWESPQDGHRLCIRRANSEAQIGVSPDG